MVDDTDPVVRSMVIAQLKAMSPSERAKRIHSLNRACEALAVAGIRQRHPHAHSNEVRMRLGVLRNGAELMRLAYGWDPVDRDD
jgi:hypothetical protein